MINFAKDDNAVVDITISLLRLLSISNNKRIQNVTSYVAAGYGLYSLGRTIHKNVKPPDYSVIVKDEDEHFVAICNKLLEILPPEKQYSLRGGTVKVDSKGRIITNGFEMEDEQATKKKMHFFYNGLNEQKIIIDGEVIIVWRSETESKFKTSSSLVFLSKTLEGQKKVLEFLSAIVEKSQEKKTISVYGVNQWGESIRQAEVEDRPLDSIFLPAEQKKILTDDLDEFFSKKDRYKELHIPYHRGYLFYGPPGTGKSTLIKGIATSYNLDLYLFSISTFTSDAQLLSAISSVTPNSIVALEDIDVISAAKERTEKRSTVTLSGLANALDGITTPEGVVIILSTNKQKELDEAIIRTGRTDLKLNITYAIEEQVHDIFYRFYPDYDSNVKFNIKKPTTTSDVFNICKENFSNPDKAKKQIYKLIGSK